MPTIPFAVVGLAVGGTFQPLTGSQYEFLPYPATVEIGIVADAAGVLATIYSGPDVLMEEGEIPNKAAAPMPVYPDDFFLFDEAAVQDRLKILCRNPTAAVRTIRGAVRITPLA